MILKRFHDSFPFYKPGTNSRAYQREKKEIHEELVRLEISIRKINIARIANAVQVNI